MSEGLDKLLGTIPCMPVEKLVKLFVKTREAKSVATKEWEAKEAEFKLILEACENQMLKKADETGVEGFKTPFGTTYTAHDTKISISDHSAFHAFVMAQGDLSFFQARVSNKHVEEYMEANGQAVPPGLNLFRNRVMRVRKA